MDLPECVDSLQHTDLDKENCHQSSNELILREDNICIVLHELRSIEQIHQKHPLLLLIFLKVYELQRNPVSSSTSGDLPNQPVKDLLAGNQKEKLLFH